MTQLLDQVNRTLHLRYKNSKHELFATARNIREGFRNILANMWNGWVSKQSLPKAAKCVGITATGLNVNFMQTEKFEQAAGILEGNKTNEVPETPHAYVLSPQNIRKNSALYWKSKFMSAQVLVEESNEKNVHLDQIPGLLTINKITQKRTETNIRVAKCADQCKAKICSKW